MIRLAHEDDLDSAELLVFLREIEADTIPPLASRVDLTAYADKICRLADCVVARDDDRIVGIYAGYFNNLDTREGYLTIQAVAGSHRGSGLGGRLLDAVVEVAAGRGMTSLLLETSERNQPVLALHEGRGFVRLADRVPDTPGSIYMRLHLDDSADDSADDAGSTAR